MTNKNAPTLPKTESFTSNDERDVGNFLANPNSHKLIDSKVEILETHASRVFLAGDKAYKIKKHVTLPFLDFSTLAARKYALERELELNRPHAPSIYCMVLPLTRETNGQIAIAGNGTIIDYVLEMARFDQSALMSALAAKGPLTADVSDSLADMVARYHTSAPIVTGTSPIAAIQTTIANLQNQIAELSSLFGHQRTASLSTALSQATANAIPVMAARASQGAIRRCHGDLHLNNIVMLDGIPTPFDALEFDERLGIIDVFYDLAFLLMDLDARGDRTAANRVFNRYMNDAPLGNEIAGLRLMPLFLAARALVRAVVNAERIRQVTTNDAEAWSQKARHYFRCAETYITPQHPALIAIGGLSGTGKSTLARNLAADVEPFPGAIHLRSDIERKKLFAVAETERLPKSAYTPEITAKVYDRVTEMAIQCLNGGISTIIDVVAAKADERDAIAAIARAANVPFVGLWLEAPIDILMTRVAARTHDASDADTSVVKKQSAYDLGNISWSRIDAGRSSTETLRQARNILTSTGVIRSNGA